jgi:AmmeMemoRadiSam system protein A
MAIPEEDRTVLLKLARDTVAAEAGGMMPPPAPRTEGVLAQRRGCFVTLTNGGRLRGCIGTFSPTKPLAEQIIEMAAASARDPRFVRDPVTPAEVKELTVGLSVLSELVPIDNPLDIELGVHGIYIIRGAAGGCFLPEVATETGWSKEEFLSQCCAGKAGMAPDAWKDPQTKVYVFTSEKFSDE